MWIAGGIGLLAGAFLVLLLPRILPFAADTHVAAIVMGADRISAGYAMIGAADPFEAQKIIWGTQFYDINRGKISACLEAAKKAMKDQKCSITVPNPEQQGTDGAGRVGL